MKNNEKLHCAALIAAKFIKKIIIPINSEKRCIFFI
jgi:hypothetical protein